MKIRMTSVGLPAALLAASLFGACSNTARGIQEDTAQNTEKAREASANAAAATERAAADAKEKSGPTAEAMKNGLEKAADATKTGLERAAEATKDAAHDAAVATRNATADAAEKSKGAADSTGDAMDGAKQTMTVKMALVADKSVDASGINVETDSIAKTVTLKGHVPSAAQRTAAGQIARTKAPNYVVVNNLTVG